MLTRLSCLLLLLVCGHAFAAAQFEEFSYQGRLELNGQPANGAFPMTFALFDAFTGGNQIGATEVRAAVNVGGGTFAVVLGYPSAFTGTQLYLEISVNGQTIAGRQKVTAAPVAQFSLNGARALDYAETNPSSAASPALVKLNALGPFTIYGACGIDSGSGDVTVQLFADSVDNYDERVLVISQLNDAGAATVTPLNTTNTSGLHGVILLTVAASNFRRIWAAPVILHSRATPATVVSLDLYLGVDARPASTGCTIQGTASLGI